MKNELKELYDILEQYQEENKELKDDNEYLDARNDDLEDAISRMDNSYIEIYDIIETIMNKINNRLFIHEIDKQISIEDYKYEMADILDEIGSINLEVHKYV